MGGRYPRVRARERRCACFPLREWRGGRAPPAAPGARARPGPGQRRPLSSLQCNNECPLATRHLCLLARRGQLHHQRTGQRPDGSPGPASLSPDSPTARAGRHTERTALSPAQSGERGIGAALSQSRQRFPQGALPPAAPRCAALEADHSHPA